VRKVVYHGSARDIWAILYHARVAPGVFRQLRVTSQDIAGGMYLFQDSLRNQVTLVTIIIIHWRFRERDHAMSILLYPHISAPLASISTLSVLLGFESLPTSYLHFLHVCWVVNLFLLWDESCCHSCKTWPYLCSFEWLSCTVPAHTATTSIT
jgi:hypothetical protein